MGITRIGLVILAVVVAIGGAFFLFRAFDERAAPPIVIEDAAALRPVVVDVRGEVATAGVYELPPGARLQDAIAAAGGLTAAADLSLVNLARRLRDGELVAIAPLPAAGATPSSPDALAAGGAGEATAPKVNINTASMNELDVLPGIGEVTAARIIAFREEHGPFRSVDDLIHVDGISARMIDEFRPMVTTSP